MTELISVPFGLILLACTLWTTFFSFTNKSAVRGWRNLGILACYLVGLSMLWGAGLKTGIVTWSIFGLFGGAVYFMYDMIAAIKARPTGEKSPVSLAHFVFGLVAWPVMMPEAIEYLLAEFGLLKVRESNENPSPEAG